MRHQPQPSPQPSSARSAVAVLTAACFINALGGILVFPLGPFIATMMAIPEHKVGLASSAYTLAAAAGGLVGAIKFDRLDKRLILMVGLVGLGLGSLATSLVRDFDQLVAARAVTGFCAGPVLGAIFALVTDIVPLHQRNRAVGLMIGSYGMALVMGPAIGIGLVAATGSWRLSFLALALLCVVVLGFGSIVLQRSSVAPGQETRLAILRVLRQPESLLGLALIGCNSFATLLISPNLAAYALYNAGLNQGSLSASFAIGGTLAIATTWISGWVMDRIGTLVAVVGVALLMSLVLSAAFLISLPPTAAMLAFAVVLAAQLARSTVAQANATHVARPSDRLSFQCLAASCTNLSQAAGAAVATGILGSNPDHSLTGMKYAALSSIAISWLMVPLVGLLRKRLSGAQAPDTDRTAQNSLPFDEPVH